METIKPTSSDVNEIIKECYRHISRKNGCPYAQIYLGDCFWGELEEVTPYSSCHPNYDEIIKEGIRREENGVFIFAHDRLILKPWKLNRFFRVLTFRYNFNYI